ncbi:hypothetical protein RJ640_003372 [Escallonia rubra]|uniref:GAG-pre-integrase domain-containing protein n=1 Tax=Escallonia rubra TaxID=112253 RepID=A0AA88QRZ4_9ASTE|nr:hypothetical protein RJ640_003372 [Escallonia rubra]
MKKDNYKTADVVGVVEDNFDGRVMRIINGALIMMNGLKQSSLYLLKGSTITEVAVSTTSSSDIDFDTTQLWHMRLGHTSKRDMNVLSRQGLLGSKKIGKLDFCEHRVFGKQCRVKFSRVVHTTKDVLKLKFKKISFASIVKLFMGLERNFEYAWNVRFDQAQQRVVELQVTSLTTLGRESVVMSKKRAILIGEDQGC